MSADAYRAMNAMMRIYAMLHPQHCHSRDVRWEMDLDTFEALAREAPSRDSTAVMINHYVADVEMRCLGIAVSVVERPGVRLIIEVPA